MGNALTSITSFAGMIVGAVVWFVITPRLGLTGVALSYVCGTTVISGIRLVVVWRQDRHRWSLPMGKVLLGLAVAGGMVTIQRVAALPLLLDPAFGVVFLAIWWALSRAAVLGLAIPGLRRERS